MLRRLWCRVFGHRYDTEFREEGRHWCWSAGGFDCVCRCGRHWYETPNGAEALKRSEAKDPRLGKDMFGEPLKEPLV